MIVITGASDGLGNELAKIYQADGKKVVNLSRTSSSNADVNISVNLREGEEIKKAAKKILEIGEPLEAIINCAGVMSVEPLGTVTEDEIKRVMATNVKGPILLVSNLIDRIKKDGTDIVNVSSTVGTRGLPLEQSIYVSSKWALRGFSANLREELKDTHCRVISYCPGGFVSKIAEKAVGKPMTDPSSWMDSSAVALFLKQTLDLPKNMQVSEVIIDRKVGKQ